MKKLLTTVLAIAIATPLMAGRYDTDVKTDRYPDVSKKHLVCTLEVNPATNFNLDSYRKEVNAVFEDGKLTTTNIRGTKITYSVDHPPQELKAFEYVQPFIVKDGLTFAVKRPKYVEIYTDYTEKGRAMLDGKALKTLTGSEELSFYSCQDRYDKL